MSGADARARRLVIGIGNPSRGDDALGPLAVERLEALAPPDTEFLTDYQLQVEYLLDLKGREEVIFVDATVKPAVEDFSFLPVRAERDTSYSSHELSPQALLAAFERHYDQAPPPCFILAIRGRRFELGEGLSDDSAAGLAQALSFLSRRLQAPS